MRFSFYVDKPNEVRSAIIGNVSLAGRRLRFGTGVSIEPKHWDPKRQDLRSSAPQRNAQSKRLAAIRTFVIDAYNELNPNGKDKLLSSADIDNLNERIKLFIAPEERQKKLAHQTFEQYFEEFNETYTIRTRTGQITTRRPGKATIFLYRRTLRLLKEWSAKTKRPLAFETIDESMYTSYCNWLVQSQGLVDSSVSNHIKVLKTFMRWSRDKGYHTTTAWERFWRDSRTGDTIALTVEELRRMRDLDLSENPRLARVRDIFLLQVFTGMRYGDLMRIEPKHFDDTAGIIRITTAKTHTECIIPITQPLASLLERYPSRLFEFPSDVKANLYLKELGKVMGLDKPTTTAKYVGGERIETQSLRADLLTTHVARRTFISTSTRFGLPEAVISAVTGHAAKGMLQKHYIMFDEEAIRDMVCKAWEQL